MAAIIAPQRQMSRLFWREEVFQWPVFPQRKSVKNSSTTHTPNRQGARTLSSPFATLSRHTQTFYSADKGRAKGDIPFEENPAPGIYRVAIHTSIPACSFPSHPGRPDLLWCQVPLSLCRDHQPDAGDQFRSGLPAGGCESQDRQGQGPVLRSFYCRDMGSAQCYI